MVSVNGKTLRPFDFAVSTDGTSFVANYYADAMKMQLKNMEEVFNNESGIAQHIAKNSKIELIDCLYWDMKDLPKPLSLTFQTDSGDKIIFEYNDCNNPIFKIYKNQQN